MRDRIRDLRDRLPALPAGLPIGATLATWMEAFLLLLLAIQGARLVWALVTPLGMLGEWQVRSPASLPADARAALFKSFDPFTGANSGDAANAQVTGLALQLFGTRINEGSGQGSAIIATPDGLQSSFIVGDAVMPGVTLRQIAYDHVVLDRGGKAETLFLDQSTGGSGGDGSGSGGPPPAPGNPGTAPVNSGANPGALTSVMIQRDIGFAPRSDGGRVSGLVVTQQGGGQGFTLAGFQPGDIITQINGRPITSVGDIQAMQAQLRPGARLSLMVERGAATVPLAIILSGEQ
ncbi:MAG TPA: type II secretion system protein N [Sphingobium sp.]|uniref:type II secretion system protein N n=1 Tax=Sphingobium sp. TaxID=1912891 RepID=UPI002ED5E423